MENKEECYEGTETFKTFLEDRKLNGQVYGKMTPEEHTTQNMNRRQVCYGYKKN